MPAGAVHLKSPVIGLAAVSRQKIGCCSRPAVSVAPSRVPAEVGFAGKIVPVSLLFSGQRHGVSEAEDFAISGVKAGQEGLLPTTADDAP